MKSLPVLIDCDPGADDTFALLRALILHSKDNNPLQIKAITTSGGNVSADKTYLNAQRMCQFTGIDTVPIGKDLRPITSSGDASHIHGEDGIGNLSQMLPIVHTTEQPLNSVDLIISTIENNPGIILLATGPLTNLAAAEKKKPGILNQCTYIIAMGGSTIGGNVTPTAEFNIRYDADSADYVVQKCSHLILIPLDVTTSFVYSPDETEHILGQVNHTQKAEFLRALTKFTIGTNRMFRETHYQDGFFVHDAHTIGFLMYPHLYRGTFVDLKIETTGQYTKGMTVVDRRNHSRSHLDLTMLLTEVDKKGFLEAMVEDFKQFDFS